MIPYDDDSPVPPFVDEDASFHPEIEILMVPFQDDVVGDDSSTDRLNDGSFRG